MPPGARAAASKARRPRHSRTRYLPESWRHQDTHGLYHASTHNLPDRATVSHAGGGISRWWWLYLPFVTLALLAAAHYDAPEWALAWLRGELGAVECAQFALIALASLLGFRLLLLPVVRANRWLRAWILCAAVGAFYVAGEEISWGQHVFGWSTPEMIGQINEQNETNLHNVSIWFNGVPLTILEIGVFVGGVLMPLAALRRPENRLGRLAIVVPTPSGLPCASIAIAIRVSKNVFVHIQGGEYPLLLRAGEIEELFLYAFILIYLVELRARLMEAWHRLSCAS